VIRVIGRSIEMTIAESEVHIGWQDGEEGSRERNHYQNKEIVKQQQEKKQSLQRKITPVKRQRQSSASCHANVGLEDVPVSSEVRDYSKNSQMMKNLYHNAANNKTCNHTSTEPYSGLTSSSSSTSTLSWECSSCSFEDCRSSSGSSSHSCSRRSSRTSGVISEDEDAETSSSSGRSCASLAADLPLRESGDGEDEDGFPDGDIENELGGIDNSCLQDTALSSDSRINTSRITCTNVGSESSDEKKLQDCQYISRTPVSTPSSITQKLIHTEANETMVSASSSLMQPLASLSNHPNTPTPLRPQQNPEVKLQSREPCSKNTEFSTEYAKPKPMEKLGSTNSASIESIEPKVSFFPLKISISDDTSQGFCRTCTAVVTGTVLNYSNQRKYVLAAFAVQRNLPKSSGVDDATVNPSEEATVESEVYRLALHEKIFSRGKHVDNVTKANLEKARFRVKVTGLCLGGQLYRFSVLSMHPESDVWVPVGCQDGSVDTQTVVTPCLPPSCPENFRAHHCGVSSVELEWQAPLCDGGSKIASYKVERIHDLGHPKSSDDMATVYEGLKTSVRLAELNPATTYQFRVSATNVESGTGPWSTIVQIKPEDCLPPRPGSVCDLHDTIDPWQLHLSWDPIPQSMFLGLDSEDEHESCSSHPFTYHVELCNQSDQGHNSTVDERKIKTQDNSFTVVYSGAEPSCIIKSGLQPAQTYLVRVFVENAFGHSPPSSISQVQTLGLAPEPPCPPCVESDIEQTSQSSTFISGATPTTVWSSSAQGALVTWDSPVATYGSEVRMYAVEHCPMEEHDFRVVYSGQQRSCYVAGFQPGSSHRIRVLAMNDFGWSDPSCETIFTLAARPPRPPLGGVHANLESGRVSLSWCAAFCDDDSSPIEYIVWCKCIRPLSSLSKCGSSVSTKKSTSHNSCLEKFLLFPFATKIEVPARPPKPLKKWKSGNLAEAVIHNCLRVVKIEAIDTNIASARVHAVIDCSCSKSPSQLVPMCDLYPRLCAGQLCQALVPCRNESSVDEWCKARVEYVTESGYWVKFLDNAEILGIQFREPSEIIWECEGDVLFTGKQEIAIARQGKDINLWTEVYRGPSLNHNLENLMPGFSYIFQVAAVQGDLVSERSIESDHLLMGSPRPPRPDSPYPKVTTSNLVELALPLHSVDSESLELWEIAMCDAIVSQGNSCRSSQWTSHYANGDEDSLTVTLPKSGTTYAFKLRIWAHGQASSWSPPVAVRSESSVPQQPQGLFVEILEASFLRRAVRVAWEKPIWHGGENIVGYRVETSLTYGSSFAVEAPQAENVSIKSQASPRSAASSVLSYSGKLRPSKAKLCKRSKRLANYSSVTSSASTESITISDSTQTEFVSAHPEQKLLAAHTREFVVEPVKPGARVAVRVFAISRLGESSPSSVARIRMPETEPGPLPGQVTFPQVTSTSVKIEWQAPEYDGGASVVGYETQMVRFDELDSCAIASRLDDETDSLSSIQFLASQAPRAMLKKLQPATKYSFRVRAVNANGSGRFSKWFIFSTKKAQVTVDTPTNLIVEKQEPLTFSWEQPESSAVVEFRLQIAQVESKREKRPAFEDIYTGEACTFVYQHAKPAALYKARVQAVIQGVCSPYSRICNLRTADIVSVQQNSQLHSEVPNYVTQKRRGGGKIGVVPNVGEKSAVGALVKENINSYYFGSSIVEKTKDAVRSRVDSTTTLVAPKDVMRMKRLSWYLRYPRLACACMGAGFALFFFFVYFGYEEKRPLFPRRSL